MRGVASPTLDPCTSPGALVLSLDFELHWGVRHMSAPDGPYAENLEGARAAVPRMLELFSDYQVAATWAVVGLLMATSRDEARAAWPRLRPTYADPRLDPYQQEVGMGEADDHMHYAASLVEQIRAVPRQEVASHTFSHFYCLEPGQTVEQFEADLQSAIRIARARGIEVRTLVFPRNQVPSGYLPVLRRAGIVAYRGTPDAWVYRSVNARERDRPLRRALRIADAYLPLVTSLSVRWSSLKIQQGLVNVPGSRFLRPSSRRYQWVEPVRRGRIRREMLDAARKRRLYHLYWHPHNFGRDLDDNIDMLRVLLDDYSRCRTEYGMESLAMGEVADRVLSGGAVRTALDENAEKAPSSGV
jgi:peptidoglycan/xylan/chitin deacetylase (PgdA/CDA1 family)